MVPIREASEMFPRSGKKHTLSKVNSIKSTPENHVQERVTSSFLTISTFRHFICKKISCFKMQEFMFSYLQNNRNALLLGHLERELKKTRGLLCYFLPLGFSCVLTDLETALSGRYFSAPLGRVSGTSTAPAFKHFFQGNLLRRWQLPAEYSHILDFPG